jgi:hypothetical protein
MAVDLLGARRHVGLSRRGADEMLGRVCESEQVGGSVDSWEIVCQLAAGCLRPVVFRTVLPVRGGSGCARVLAPG